MKAASISRKSAFWLGVLPGEKRFLPVSVESDQLTCLPEPFTPEPTESYSKADIDEYVDALVQISNEAYTTPEVVLNAPYAGPISKLENDHIKDWRELCVTWRAYKKQNGLA